LAFDAAHFSALVPMESNSKSITKGRLISKYKISFSINVFSY